MKKTKILISLRNKPDLEQQVRSFLLEKCDKIRLRRRQWSVIGLSGVRKCGDDRDAKAEQVKKNLEKFFIKKIRVKEQGRDSKSSGLEKFFLYRLSKELKQMLETAGLLWTADKAGKFYGFEDPAFYQAESLIGKLSSYRGAVLLYLDENEKDEFIA
jgi:hypothetical protein